MYLVDNSQYLCCLIMHCSVTPLSAMPSLHCVSRRNNQSSMLARPHLTSTSPNPLWSITPSHIHARLCSPSPSPFLSSTSPSLSLSPFLPSQGVTAADSLTLFPATWFGLHSCPMVVSSHIHMTSPKMKEPLLPSPSHV